MSYRGYPDVDISVELVDGTVVNSHNYVWNTVTLAWEKATGGDPVGANVNVANFPAVYPVNDNGGSLTTDTPQLPTTLTGSGNLKTAISESITLTVSDGGSSLTVDAPVGTPVATRLSDGSAFLTTTSGRLSVDASGVAVPITDNGGSLTVDGTVATTQSGSWTVTADAGTNLNTSLLALESGGNLATLAGGITASVYQENLKQVNGVTVNVGTGTAGTGTQRVAVASDSSINAVQSGTWTVTANLGTVSGLALDATLTGGTAKNIVRGGALGSTSAADVTSTAVNADHRALDIIVADSQLDAFSRIVASGPVLVWSVKQDLGAQDYLFTTSTALSGTITYSAARASTSLAVTTSSGSSAIRQSKAYIPYQTGKASTLLATGVMGNGQTGTRKRLGLFDVNNGIYFELNGTTKNIVVRSSITGAPVETSVAQSSWNLDKLDGTGVSGITLDYTKAQIFIIDFQWLGVGRIRFGFHIDGQNRYCHEVRNANNITGVFMSTPNLPVRYEIVNTAGVASTSTLEMICAAVSVGGGFDQVGRPVSVSNFVTPKSIGTTLIPLIAVRPKSTVNSPPVIVNSLSILGGNVGYYWGVYINPTITGGTAASYTSVDAYSYLEYDVAMTGTVSGGLLVASGYASSAIRDIFFAASRDYYNLLSTDLAGTKDTLVLAVRQLSGAANDYYGSLVWTEFV